MRPAPPLSLHCSGRGAWRQLRVALLALAAAVPAGWAALHLEATGPVALLAAAIAAAVAIGAGLRAIRPEPVLLAWDGSHWNVDGQPAALDLMLDLGAGLLLRLRPASGGRALWLAVTATEAGAGFHGLRAAVHARTPTRRPAIVDHGAA